ncbi:hypothetical protein BC939DRAFT_445904 [Gamsiella multidivaricata]|uniref:uncharacterized protein n=1 Tax=Gamsiella multidivaricata TaxID=101098 RepID=UPI00221F9EDB|nr:uncharacterized protein BC939DRAFT_445904 [Gamsiella multidivaricata]KAI7827142.1 hypothetical protein BC939DRAFT_445904 [Gamsiella multidivaricata]
MYPTEQQAQQTAQRWIRSFFLHFLGACASATTLCTVPYFFLLPSKTRSWTMRNVCVSVFILTSVCYIVGASIFIGHWLFYGHDRNYEKQDTKSKGPGVCVHIHLHCQLSVRKEAKGHQQTTPTE